MFNRGTTNIMSTAPCEAQTNRQSRATGVHQSSCHAQAVSPDALLSTTFKVIPEFELPICISERLWSGYKAK